MHGLPLFLGHGCCLLEDVVAAHEELEECIIFSLLLGIGYRLVIAIGEDQDVDSIVPLKADLHGDFIFPLDEGAFRDFEGGVDPLVEKGLDSLLEFEFESGIIGGKLRA